jgi:hypothetical protein
VDFWNVTFYKSWIFEMKVNDVIRIAGPLPCWFSILIEPTEIPSKSSLELMTLLRFLLYVTGEERGKSEERARKERGKSEERARKERGKCEESARKEQRKSKERAIKEQGKSDKRAMEERGKSEERAREERGKKSEERRARKEERGEKSEGRRAREESVRIPPPFLPPPLLFSRKY